MSRDFAGEQRIPKGWMVVKLREVVQPRGEKVSPQDFPDAPFLGMKNVEAHTSRIIATEPAKNFSSHASRFYSGDVLYGRLRPYLNKVVRPQFDGLASGEFIVLPENALIDGSFLKYRLISGDFVSFASHLNEGDRPRVNFKQIGDFQLLLPPLDEQRRIVAKIEELFSQLDAGVTALEQARAQLKRYRQALLKAAFEGRLTADWRRAHAGELEPADALLARIRTEREARWRAQLAEWEEAVRAWEAAGKPGKKPRKPRKPKELPPLTEEERAELPELPDGWAWEFLGNIAEISGGITKNQKRKNLPLQVPFLRVANVYANRLELDDVDVIGVTQSEFERTLLRPGDLLIVEGNGSIEQIGRVAMWNGEIDVCLHQNHLIKARLPSQAIPKFVLYFLLSERGRKMITTVASSTSGLHTLSLSKVSKLIIPLCSLDEQEAIVRFLEAQLSTIDHLDQTIEQALARAAALRQAILRRAFAGRLLPPSQPPPASAVASQGEE